MAPKIRSTRAIAWDSANTTLALYVKQSIYVLVNNSTLLTGASRQNGGGERVKVQISGP